MKASDRQAYSIFLSSSVNAAKKFRHCWNAYSNKEINALFGKLCFQPTVIFRTFSRSGKSLPRRKLETLGHFFMETGCFTVFIPLLCYCFV